MARQTINLAASTFRRFVFSPYNVAWNPPTGSYPQINASLVPTGSSAYLTTVEIYPLGEVRLQFGPNNASALRADLTADFEDTGGFTIEAGGQTLTVFLEGADVEEPYIWTPSNSVEVIAFFTPLYGEQDGAVSAVLTIFDSRGPDNISRNGVVAIAASRNGVDLVAASRNGVDLF